MEEIKEASLPIEDNIPSEEPIIELNKVAMEYYMQTEKIDNMKEFFIRLVKGKIKKMKKRILEEITFSVRKGESIGIIGHNGAGKSTILKLITGIIKPTAGTVKVHGSVAPLLNLGAGFDYEATARENIFLNGAIIGYTQKEIKSKFASIVEFAELENYVDVPLKNFSSGMVARLGFAIAIDVEPDILLVDEILSVGDENFRQKCSQKIEELQKRGVTFIIVSHNMSQVKKLCQRAIWIENGKIVEAGDSKEICDKYQEYSKNKQ
ncbi:MAG: ABC transporter ATP-binding protein [Ruminococcaceae bacterium]|nr:ABC transporter ATP-binding protein [Oscillospiraceae bacterium]